MNYNGRIDSEYLTSFDRIIDRFEAGMLGGQLGEKACL
jgi:hypothetical protein